MKNEFEQILQKLSEEGIVRNAIETAKKQLGNVNRIQDLFSIKRNFEDIICNHYRIYSNIGRGSIQTIARNILRATLKEYSRNPLCKIESLYQEHKNNIESVLNAIDIPYCELPASMKIGLKKITRDKGVGLYTRIIRVALEKIFIDFVVREI